MIRFAAAAEGRGDADRDRECERDRDRDARLCAFLPLLSLRSVLGERDDRRELDRELRALPSPDCGAPFLAAASRASSAFLRSRMLRLYSAKSAFDMR